MERVISGDVGNLYQFIETEKSFGSPFQYVRFFILIFSLMKLMNYFFIRHRRSIIHLIKLFVLKILMKDYNWFMLF
jgi:hypothetical protein